ncbi:transporter [Aneurinibacillus migulanus]|uniref:Transporter n=1 Tax=Aneurinibacillus migulanus TaxID=47500 RepID=A0A0D1XWP1_ANEMI|nr:cation diffusion facilitator family transporter [Aneurinibacillus migulanus]KIV51502.1 transporter [Aneurinibacillus migulanus]KIV54990.1 transporter [Aneurinibacillus migulanus]KON94444.1 transporter [Aneurinibacillus migulanus]KPD09924.1 transporter [Aneurinibacillus migulanus]MCP1358466.1 cation diffusion facilitator family transporter [Aneurinibacillus migulanus]
MEEQQYVNIKMGERGAWLSIIAYLILSVLKLVIGYFTGSKALMADGLNNTTDIMASIAVLIGLRFSRKPPDEDHPYGHWRAETIASLIASFIMMAVGLQVLYNAGQSIVDFRAETPDMLAAWTALGCAFVMYGVYRFNRDLAHKVNSQAVMAAAKDNLSDAWVSIGAAVGVFGAQLGLPWLDPLAAVVVGFMICRTAWEIFREASHNLTDGFDEQELEKLRGTIEEIPGVKSLNDIKARAHGNMVLVDVVIHVDPRLNVIESHRITEEIEEKMREEHGIMNVHVHVEPWKK